MNWNWKLKIKLFRLVEPVYLKLQSSVQPVLNRIAKLKAISDGVELRNKFRKKKRELEGELTYLQEAQKRQIPEHEMKIRQASCPHIKGVSNGIRFPVKDFNVIMHTFIDGSMVIKCLGCRREWWKTDKYEDPDWKEAGKMLDQTTNAPSSSEIVQPGGREDSRTKEQKEKPNGPNYLSQKLS